MQYRNTTVRATTKVLVAVLVLTALAAFVSVVSDASREAVSVKQAQFEAASGIQLAAREKQGSKLAQRR